MDPRVVSELAMQGHIPLQEYHIASGITVRRVLVAALLGEVQHPNNATIDWVYLDVDVPQKGWVRPTIIFDLATSQGHPAMTWPPRMFAENLGPVVFSVPVGQHPYADLIRIYGLRGDAATAFVELADYCLPFWERTEAACLRKMEWTQRLFPKAGAAFGHLIESGAQYVTLSHGGGLRFATNQVTGEWVHLDVQSGWRIERISDLPTIYCLRGRRVIDGREELIARDLPPSMPAIMPGGEVLTLGDIA